MTTPPTLEFNSKLQARPDNSPAIARIRAVDRIAADLYDEREEGTAGCFRKLEVFEALFISAVNAIGRTTSKELADGHRVWGNGAAYDALCNLTYRTQAAQMEAALASYKAEKSRFEGDYDDSLEEVAHAMAAE